MLDIRAAVGDAIFELGYILSDIATVAQIRCGCKEKDGDAARDYDGQPKAVALGAPDAKRLIYRSRTSVT
jgi:hypothetical protein